MSLVNINIVANFLGNIWNVIMSMAFVPVYISYLGMEAYGLIGFFTALQGWMVILDFGLTQTLAREMSRYKSGAYAQKNSIQNLLFSVECIYFLIAFCLSVAWFVLAGWVSSDWLNVEKLNSDLVIQSVQWIGIVAAFRWLTGLYKGILGGLQHQVSLNLIVSTFATVRSIGVIAVLAWIDPSILAFFKFHGLISFLELVCFWGYIRWVVPGSTKAGFSFSELRRVWAFAGGMFLISLLAVLLTQVDKLLISALLPLEEFGVYALAGTVSTILYQITIPISNAVSPKFVELVSRNKYEEISSSYHYYTRLSMLFLAPVSCFLIFFSYEIVFLWTGNQELSLQVGPLVSLLGIGVLLNCSMHIPYLLQLAYGWTGLTVKANSIAVLLLIPSLILVVPEFGATGSALIWITLNLGYVLFLIPFMHRRILPGDKRRWYFKSFLPGLVMVVIAAVLLRQLLPVADGYGFTGQILSLTVIAFLLFLVSLICFLYLISLEARPFVVVMIQGGLGNQLFCYAAARALALRNNLDLYLDVNTGFIRDVIYRRSYALHHFMVQGRVLKSPVLPRRVYQVLRFLCLRINGFLPYQKRFYLYQEKMDYDSHLVNQELQRSIYLEGYWQSEKYFCDFAAEIRQDLQMVSPMDEENLRVADMMSRVESVSLHIRWFDDPVESKGHNISKSYYTRAMATIEDRLNEPHYFVFSDNMALAKEKIIFPENRTTFITINNTFGTEYKDLWLMSQCRHNITANSTFSWWGAWLNPNPEKIVVTPDIKLEGKTAWGFDGLIPESWVKV